jgi:rubrerythrin
MTQLTDVVPGDLPAEESHFEKVTRWYNLKAQVAKLQEEEKALRQELAATFTAKDKGSERRSIGWGKDLKATFKTNYTVAKEAYALSEGSNVIPSEVRQAVFMEKTVIEVSEVELAKVKDPAILAALSEIITSRAGLPTLEVVDEKKRG